VQFAGFRPPAARVEADVIAAYEVVRMTEEAADESPPPEGEARAAAGR
jgi:hypothetical protein